MTPTVGTLTRRLRAHALDVTDAERVAARAWYPTACEHADRIADVLDVDREAAASIIAAYSIRTPWTDNLAHAHEYARGGRPPGLRVRTVIADAAVCHGFAALRGPKTHAFARAIAGDESAVVIDVWMGRAMRVDRVTPALYPSMVAAVERIAVELDETPRDTQALLWTRVRGSAA